MPMHKPPQPKKGWRFYVFHMFVVIVVLPIGVWGEAAKTASNSS